MKTKLFYILIFTLFSFSAYSADSGGTIGGTQSICYNTKPTPFTQVYAGVCGTRSIAVYQWQKSVDGGSSWSNISGATSYNYTEPNNLTVTTKYKRLAPTGTGTGSCGTLESNVITVTVYSPVAGGSIASDQSICYNSLPSALTNASNPTGGNGTYTYSWVRSYDNGSTWSTSLGSSITYSETANQTQSLKYKRIATSGSCGSAESNVITVTVYSPLTGGTVGTNQTICSNSLPSPFTSLALPSGGNGSYSYVWQKSIDGGSTWADIPSTNSITFTETNNLTVDTKYKRIATSGSCGSVESNVITVTLFSPLSGGTISANQTICYNTLPSAFSNVTNPTGGNGTYTYVWRKSVDNGATWSDITNTNIISFTETNNLTVTTVYKRIATSGTCGSVESNFITVTVLPQVLGGTIANNQNVCFNAAPAAFYNVSLPTGGTGTYTYTWKKSLNGGTIWSDIASTNSINYTETNNITQTTTYARVATSGSCGSAFSNFATATVYAELLGGSISGSQTIPYNTVPTIFNNSDNPTGGNGTYTYAWKKSVDNGSTWVDIIGASINSYTELSNLTTTTKYKRIATSGSCGSAESNVITVTVLPQLLGGSIAADQTICYNTTPTQFANSVSPSGGNGTFTYVWKKSVNGGTSWDDIPVINTNYYNCPALTQTTLFKRVATSGTSGSAESNVITITVLSPLTSGSIGASQTISYDSTPETFTNEASPTGGTGTYTYLWKKSINNGAVWTDISGSNTNFYASSNLTVTTLFKRVVTSGTCGSAESNIITVTVFSPLTGGSIAADQTLCYNTKPDAFSNVSLPTGGTGAYTYQWKKSVNNGSTWADIPSANASTFSETNSLTVTTLYKRIATSGTFGSIESNVVTVTILPQLLGGSIGTNQTLCYGTKPATFTSLSLPSGGSGSFTYQWQKSLDNGSTWADIPVATNPDYTDINNLTVTTKYKRLAIFGCGTVESNVITAFVLPALNGGAISADQTLCYGLKPAVFSSSTDPTGSSTFSFQWQKKESGSLTWSDIPSATALSYTEPNNLTVSTSYKRLANSNGCGTVESNPITVTVYPALSGGAIAADQTICNSTVPASFSNVDFPSGGNGSYTYIWKKSVDNGSIWADINGSSNPTFAELNSLTASTQYKRVATSGTCGSVESNVVSVTVRPALTSGVIGSAQTICYSANPLPLSGTSPTGADGTFSIQWQYSFDNTNWANVFGETSETLQPIGLTANTFYRRVAFNQACNASVNSNPILITVRDKVLKPSVNVNPYYCKNAIVTLAVSNPNSSTYKWYSSANVQLAEGAQITFPPLTADFSVSVVSVLANGCASEPLALSVNLDPIKANFSFDVASVTVGNPVKFTNSSVNASYYKWNFYDGDYIFEQNPTHYYNISNGSFERKYDVTLFARSSANCSDSLKLYNAITVLPLASDVTEESLNPVQVFPNPFTDALWVKSESSFSRIQVLNALGQPLADLRYFNETKAEVRFSLFPRGVYFVKIYSTNGSTLTKKVIKQ